MRKEFKITQAESDQITNSQYVRWHEDGKQVAPSPQDMINREWDKLGVKYGFDRKTVRPIDLNDRLRFTAEES